jgi:hypothetical protein
MSYTHHIGGFAMSGDGIVTSLLLHAGLIGERSEHFNAPESRCMMWICSAIWSEITQRAELHVWTKFAFQVTKNTQTSVGS